MELAKDNPVHQVRAFRRLNLGCGVSFYSDYLNINYWENLPVGVVRNPNGTEGTVLLNWDLRDGIPVENESIEVVYHSHFLEHLDYSEGTKMLGEIHRVLKPEGIHRILVPDLKKWISSYLEDGLLIQEYRKSGVKKSDLSYPTPGAVLMGMVHGHQHKFIWDFETLFYHLNEIGFSSIEETMYQQSVLQDIKEIEPYIPLRALESLCIECRKERR